MHEVQLSHVAPVSPLWPVPADLTFCIESCRNGGSTINIAKIDAFAVPLTSQGAAALVIMTHMRASLGAYLQEKLASDAILLCAQSMSCMENASDFNINCEASHIFFYRDSRTV